MTGNSAHTHAGLDIRPRHRTPQPSMYHVPRICPLALDCCCIQLPTARCEGVECARGSTLMSNIAAVPGDATLEYEVHLVRIVPVTFYSGSSIVKRLLQVRACSAEGEGSREIMHHMLSAPKCAWTWAGARVLTRARLAPRYVPG